MRRELLAFLIASLAAIPALGAADPIFDVPTLIATPLNPRTLKRSESEGIVTEEIRFHSETDGDKQVEIFGFYSYPQGACHRPAFIWNQGGLAQASAGVTRAGARRGYATLCIDFPQPGYRSTGNYPINTGLEVGSDPRRAPIYHGAVALLKAVSYLECRPQVDKDRIGMAGASWGGFFTTLMAGIDPRLKACAAIYGTGSLELGNAWWDGVSRNGKTPDTAGRERWRQTLDPAWRLATKKTPIAWITGANDMFYPMPCVMRSYEIAAGPKRLMLLPNWHHALPPLDHDDQFYSWLGIYLQDQPRTLEVLPVVVSNQGGQLLAEWKFHGDCRTADLIASYGEAGNWAGRYWHTFKAAIHGGKCSATIPPSTVPCYVSGSVTDNQGIRCSTPLVRVKSDELRVVASRPVPPCDGCAEWGSFEPDQIEYLKQHDRSGQGRWIPKTSTDALDGKQSAILNPGKTVLAPMLSTAGFAHRFSAAMKSNQPTKVTLQVGNEHQEFPIATHWTRIELRVTPPYDLMGGLRAIVTTSPDARVLLDAVRFEPIETGLDRYDLKRGVSRAT